MFPLLAAALALRQTEVPNLKPFVIDHRTPADSQADVSFLLDAPAGKAGFIGTKGEHFIKPNGQRIRFWGVHLTDWSKGSVELPPKQDTKMWVDALAKAGVNIVRLHFLDLAAPRGIIDNTRTDTREFDKDQLDRLDYLTYNLKKRGIYMDLNLNVGRSYKPGDGVQDADKIRWAKGLVYYDPRLIELQKEYARNLLTHVNPYTKKEYREEPAIALVELVNENAIYMGFRAPTPYYDQELTTLYNQWLAKTLTRDQLLQYRHDAGVITGPVPRLQGQAIAKASPERFKAETQFYLDTERAYYHDMKAFLHGLNVKQPIIGTADHSHSNSSYTMLSDFGEMDVIDGHDYWQHPGASTSKGAMVNDPFNSTIVELSRTATAGKPYTVSETNHPFPNDYASEGIPLIASYGSLQDWDMIIMYTFEPKLSPDWKPVVGDPFDISHDPVRMTEMATGALTFLRQDVQPAKETVTRDYTWDQVLASARLGGQDRPYFTPGFPLALPLIDKVRIGDLNASQTTTFAPVTDDVLQSDTGQLRWSGWKTQAGVVTVNTPRTQSIIGFTQSSHEALDNLQANLKTAFASVTLCSLSSRPIASAPKLLLTTGSKVANTNMVWAANGRGLSNQGESPTLIEPVTGTITLKNLHHAKSVTFHPLDGKGEDMNTPLKATKTAEGWTANIGDPVTSWYTVTVAR